MALQSSVAVLNLHFLCTRTSRPVTLWCQRKEGLRKTPLKESLYLPHKLFPWISVFPRVDPEANVSCSPATQPQGGAVALLANWPNFATRSPFPLELAQQRPNWSR